MLATAALPMRLFLFSEAIVRYSSAKYSPSATNAGAVLTNTYVGKKLLNQGVGAITGSLADLCSTSGSARDGSSREQRTFAVGTGGAGYSCSGLADAMTLAIGSLFLAAEPREIRPPTSSHDLPRSPTIGRDRL